MQKQSSINLECPICIETYNPPIRVLRCGHSYCERCLHDFFSRPSAETRKCPKCSSPINIDSASGIKRLTRNFDLESQVTQNDETKPYKTYSQEPTTSRQCIEESKILSVSEIPNFLHDTLQLVKECTSATKSDQRRICQKLVSKLKSVSTEPFDPKPDLKKSINNCDDSLQKLIKDFSCNDNDGVQMMLKLNFSRYRFIKTFYTEDKNCLHKFTSISMDLKAAISKEHNQTLKDSFKDYYSILDEVLIKMYELEKIDSKIKSKQVAWFLSHYGLCCTQIKDHKKSICLHSKAIAVMEFAWGKNASNSKVFGHCLSNMAWDYESLEEFEEANTYYTEAHDAYEKATDLKEKEKKEKLSKISEYIDRVSLKLSKQKK